MLILSYILYQNAFKHIPNLLAGGHSRYVLKFLAVFSISFTTSGKLWLTWPKFTLKSLMQSREPCCTVCWIVGNCNQRRDWLRLYISIHYKFAYSLAPRLFPVARQDSLARRTRCDGSFHLRKSGCNCSIFFQEDSWQSVPPGLGKSRRGHTVSISIKERASAVWMEINWKKKRQEQRPKWQTRAPTMCRNEHCERLGIRKGRKGTQREELCFRRIRTHGFLVAVQKSKKFQKCIRGELKNGLICRTSELPSSYRFASCSSSHSAPQPAPSQAAGFWMTRLRFCVCHCLGK